MTDVLGLDLSLGATGVATADGTFVVSAKKLTGVERIDAISRELVDLGRQHDIVVLEGYAFAAHGKYTRETAELAGVVKYWLWREGVAIALVAPSTLKKFASGKGGGGKAGVAIAAGQDPRFTGHGSDEADAYFLRLMGLAAYDLADEVLDPLPRHQREALNAVLWPVLQERVA